MTQNGPVTRTPTLAISRGHIHSSIFVYGQSPQIFCIENWLADIPVVFWGTRVSTVLPKQKAQKSRLNACGIAVPFNDQTRNTGAIFSLFDSNIENASVKAVEDCAVVDSLPRSNDFVASTAFRNQLKTVRGASSNRTKRNRLAHSALDVSCLPDRIAQTS